MNALTLSAARRRDKVVILTGPAIGVKYSTPLSVRLSRALSMAWASSLATLRSAKNWVRCNCTPRRIVRALFCENVSMAVAVLAVTAIWWHILSPGTDADARNAVATDCLYCLPWALVWTFRATFSNVKSVKKGGKNVNL